MTKASLRRRVRWSIGVCLLLVALRIAAPFFQKDNSESFTRGFTDCTPVLLAIGAAYLGYCMQRRIAFMEQLQATWGELTSAIANVRYCLSAGFTPDQHREAAIQLSTAIDGIRGLFRNIDGKNGDKESLYPFEPFKDVFVEFMKIRTINNPASQQIKAATDAIEKLWREGRDEFLREFDTDKPVFTHSHWANPQHGRVYAYHKINRNPS